MSSSSVDSKIADENIVHDNNNVVDNVIVSPVSDGAVAPASATEQPAAPKYPPRDLRPPAEKWFDEFCESVSKATDVTVAHARVLGKQVVELTRDAHPIVVKHARVAGVKTLDVLTTTGEVTEVVTRKSWGKFVDLTKKAGDMTANGLGKAGSMAIDGSKNAAAATANVAQNAADASANVAKNAAGKVSN